MKGQTLIEVLLAFALLGIVMTGIVVTITSALSNASFSKNQAQASQYAQEGVEEVRNIRGANYLSFKSYSGNYCLDDGASSLGAPASCSSPNVGNFIRSVYIEQSACAQNVTRATVTVAWSDGKCNNGSYCHKSKLISCLSTVNPIDVSAFSNSATSTIPPGGGGTGITLSISPNPVTTLQVVIFTATITGAGCTPSGLVYFYWDNQTSTYTVGSPGNSNPAVATGYYPAYAMGVGTHSVYAHYVPSGTTCTGADSPTANVTVN
jgi:Tfp pilus assembly protein PilV